MWTVKTVKNVNNKIHSNDFSKSHSMNCTPDFKSEGSSNTGTLGISPGQNSELRWLYTRLELLCERGSWLQDTQLHWQSGIQTTREFQESHTRWTKRRSNHRNPLFDTFYLYLRDLRVTVCYIFDDNFKSYFFQSLRNHHTKFMSKATGHSYC